MKPGDLVQCKAGGPILVVASVGEDGTLQCWYWGMSGSQYPAFQRIDFPAAVLKPHC
jgi:uncharacterized protein YodC (DUF2158 family)